MDRSVYRGEEAWEVGCGRTCDGPGATSSERWISSWERSPARGCELVTEKVVGNAGRLDRRSAKRGYTPACARRRACSAAPPLDLVVADEGTEGWGEELRLGWRGSRMRRTGGGGKVLRRGGGRRMEGERVRRVAALGMTRGRVGSDGVVWCGWCACVVRCVVWGLGQGVGGLGRVGLAGWAGLAGCPPKHFFVLFILQLQIIFIKEDSFRYRVLQNKCT